MLTVFCTKVGDLYGREYVTRLARAVRKNLALPHRFVCTTDDSPGEGWAGHVETYSPAVRCWGWWNLEEAYSNPAWAKGGQIFYLGLDTIITGDITRVIENRVREDKLTLLKDFSYLMPDRSRSVFHNTWADGIAFVPRGGIPKLWQTFLKEVHPESLHPMHVFNTHVLRRLKILPDLWQTIAPGFVCSYKWPEIKRELPIEPVVCFHGEPRPAQAATNSSWISNYW